MVVYNRYSYYSLGSENNFTLQQQNMITPMKYTKELTDRIVSDYKAGIEIQTIAKTLGVPDRSIIAKLSSLGVYQKKTYLNKRGEVPIKKYQMIEELSEILGVPSDQLESLEKVNKSVLILLKQRLLDPKPQ